MLNKQYDHLKVALYKTLVGKNDKYELEDALLEGMGLTEAEAHSLIDNYRSNEDFRLKVDTAINRMYTNSIDTELLRTLNDQSNFVDTQIPC